MKFLHNYSFLFFRRYELRIWRSDRRPRVDLIDWKAGRALLGLMWSPPRC